MSLINVSLKLNIFAENAKATHIFFSKNASELDIVLTRTVNILTTNELVKLTMLWTTGPRWQDKIPETEGSQRAVMHNIHAILKLTQLR